MIQNPQLKWFIAILVVALPTAGAQAVIIDTVLVGNTGNTDDTHGAGYGAVGYAYSIGMYEVTNAQYAEFLNNVAATDTYGLYDELMGLSTHGGITRSGSSGTYTYSTIAGRGNMPVNFVDFWDAARFCNWLHNGQGSADTEDGAYTNIGNQSTFARQGGALFFIPTEDEWYKAAYHKNDGDTGNYFDYPTGSDTLPTAESPPGGPNSANYGWTVPTPDDYDSTNVGAYTSSESPYGTFDQGGNVSEWTETAIMGSYRVLRGGNFASDGMWLSALNRSAYGPADCGGNLGFRVASSEVIPEPGSLAMLAGLAVMGLVWWRRRKA